MLKPLQPKILIVDSQMIIAADLFLQCSELGYEVIGVITRLENVMHVLKKNNPPHIVLLNIEMEGSAEGLKTARTIFKSFKIPVIFQSTKRNDENLKILHDTQSYAFITKPFDKIALQKGIEFTISRMKEEGRWNK